MTLCKWCKRSTARTPLGFCGLSCSTKWKNAHKNPMITASPAAKARVRAAAKRQGNAHMMTAAARSKAIPKISAALKGRPGIWLGRNLPNNTRRKISKTLRGRYLGRENPNWRGGTSKRDWKSYRYKQLLRKVWARARGACQHCGAKNKSMHVHHLQSWIDAPHLRYRASNAILLCENCHYKTYKIHIHTNKERDKIARHARSRKRRKDGTFI